MEHFVLLLGLPLLACVIIAGVLGYLGIHVLKREIIFVDIALAQMGVVGMIIADLAFDAHPDSAGGYACGLGAAVVAAAFYAVLRTVKQIPLEAIIGISYAIAAAAALFLVGIASGGHVHVHGMLAGSILWATWNHLVICTVTFATVGVGFYLCRKPFRRISEDHQAALSGGVNVIGWDFLFYVFVGIVIVLATRIAGVVLVFGFLIIPATVSALFSSRWGPRLLIAWSTGILASIFGLVFAHKLDFSVGPAVAMCLGILLILAGASRRLHPMVTSALAGLICVGFAVLLFMDSPSGLQREGQTIQTETPFDPRSHPAMALDPKLALSEDTVQDMMNKAKDVAALKDLMKKVSDPELQSRIICRALDLDARQGKAMAQKFLSQGPPVFFREIVSDKLRTCHSKTMDDSDKQK